MILKFVTNKILGINWISYCSTINLLMTSKQNVTYSFIFRLSDWGDYLTPRISGKTPSRSIQTTQRMYWNWQHCLQSIRAWNTTTCLSSQGDSYLNCVNNLKREETTYNTAQHTKISHQYDESMIWLISKNSSARLKLTCSENKKKNTSPLKINTSPARIMATKKSNLWRITCFRQSCSLRKPIGTERFSTCLLRESSMTKSFMTKGNSILKWNFLITKNSSKSLSRKALASTKRPIGHPRFIKNYLNNSKHNKPNARNTCIVWATCSKKEWSSTSQTQCEKTKSKRSP